MQLFTGQFKTINWETYFSFFEHQVIEDHISTLHNHFVFLSLQGYNCEFKKKSLPQALQYYHSGEKEFDSFCTYRLAEIYNSQHQQFGVEMNREKSWFYILKASVINILRFNFDFFHAKEKLMTSMAKDGLDMEGCYALIEKYEQRETKELLRNAFRIVYGGEGEKSGDYRALMGNFDDILTNKNHWFMWDFLMGIISSDIQIKNKDFDTLREIIYKTTDALSEITNIYSYQLSVMLVFKAEDNLIISKMRDNLKTLILLIKILRFAHQYKDTHISNIEKNILGMLKLIHESVSKVKILQDRVFFTFYYCELLFNQNIMHQVVKRLMGELESMIMIKSQLGFLGFFYFLKYKIYRDKELLELSRNAFMKEIVEEDKPSESNLIIYYYLGCISAQSNQNEEYERWIEKGYKLYQSSKQDWNQLSLRGYYCYLRIRRELKRKSYNLESSVKGFQFPVYYQTATEKEHSKHIKKTEDKVQYQFQDIKILEMLTIEPCPIYLVSVRQLLCTVVKYSFMSQEQTQNIHKQLSQKSVIDHQSILPILNLVYQKLEGGFYNLYAVFPPCCFRNNSVLTFQDMVEQCWKMRKASDYYSRKTGSLSDSLIKMYAENGEPVLVRYIHSSNWETGDTTTKNEGMFDLLKERYPMQFLIKQLDILKREQLTEFLEQLYLNI